MVNTAIPDRAAPAVPGPSLLSIGGLAAEASAVLWDAERWELPRPCYVTMHHAGNVSFLFDNDPASFAALARWAESFGGVITSKPIRRDDGSPATFARVSFGYHGAPMEAYAIIPAAPATTETCPSCGTNWATEGDCPHVG